MEQRHYAYSNLSLIECLHHDSAATVEVSHINKQADRKKEKSFFYITRQYKTLIQQKYIDNLQTEHANTDMYFSLNTFRHCKRNQENLHELKALYLDIDYYNKNLTQAEVLEHLSKQVQHKKIPNPSYIVDSGRGLYYIWKINNTPPQALMRWLSMMKKLCALFEEVGADRSCVDSARIFRMTGSIHSQNKKTVRIIGGSHTTYNLNSLYKEYFEALPYEQEEKNKPKVKNNTKRKPKYYKKNNLLYLHNQYKTYQARLQDLEKLTELREYNLAPYQCRESTIFLMRYWLECTGLTSEQALAEALAFNTKLIEPLAEKEVIEIARPNKQAIQKHLYRYSNARLIELLKISEQEQEQLSSIYNPRIRQKKYNEQRRASRRNAKGQTSKQEQLAIETKAIQALHAQRYNATQIAKQLDLNERKVRRIIKLLEP